MRWPLPALLAWLAGWVLWHQLPAPWDFLASAAPALGVAALSRGPMRRAVVLGGWVLSMLLLVGMERWPPWVWALGLLALLLAYPLSAWRDAPVFPTPAGALDGLRARVPLAHEARVLDAGCGTGAGLMALRAAFPQARCEGIERSALLAWWARWRCPWAVIFHDDIWRRDWSAYSLVYLFERPESMGRAWEKARQEMTDGSWLVSLEFRVEGRRAHSSLALPGGRRIWIYRIGRSSRAADRPISREIR